MPTDDRKSAQALLVPIKIEALAVGAENADYADISANFRLLHYNGLPGTMQHPPFSGSGKLEQGIHIHWLLPDAFTKGTEDENSGEIRYPAVPDRWVITRIAAKHRNMMDIGVETKSFLVESNYISKTKEAFNRHSQPFPHRSEDGKLDYVYLGRSMDLTEAAHAKGRDYLEEITAIGYGEPTFSAMYHSCRNVFGFYDDLAGVEGGRITYQVCGWFSDSGKAPLSRVETKEEWRENLENAQWKVERDRKDREIKLCTRTVCSGAICGIDWHGPDHVYQTGMPEKPPLLAIGNSSIEAFCALLCTGCESEQDERMIHMLLGDLMDTWLEEDGVIHAEERLHTDMFESIQGEDLYVVKHKSYITEDGEAELPLETVRMLDALNRCQNGLRHSSDLLKAECRELYNVWYLYTAKERTEPMDEAEKQEWASEMERLMLRCRENMSSCAAKRQDVLDQEKRLRSSLPEAYELTRCAGERYWLPNEPVLLFAGNGMETDFNSGRSSGADKDGKLLCRTLGQLTQRIWVSGKQTRQSREITVKAVLPYIREWYLFPAEYRKILAETLLLSTDLSPLYARSIMKSQGAAADAESFKMWKEAVARAQKQPFMALLNGGDVSLEAKASGCDGVFPPKIGWQYWCEPWNPLLMEWEMSYHPDPDCISDRPNLKKWELQKVDYGLRKSIGYTRRSGKYKGRMLLTPHAVKDIYDSLKKAETKFRDKGCEIPAALVQMEQNLEKMDVMSQRMNGFSEYFHAAKLVMQLPVEEQWRNSPAAAGLAKRVFSGEEEQVFYQTMNETVSTAPYMEGVFSPVRAGYGEITGLRLLDTFGRVFTICDEDNYKLQAREMAFSENLRRRGEEDRIIFPPRIMQPVRLQAGFVSCPDGGIRTCDLPVSSPIFGWLMPEFLDGSLWAYDENGQVLGKFITAQERNGLTRILFMRSPGGVDAVCRRYEIPGEIGPKLSRCLRGILEGMNEKVKSNPQVLKQFATYLCFEIQGMKRSAAAELGTGFWAAGKPLALAEFILDLELMEKMYRQPRWSASDIALHPLNHMEFTAYLGDKRKQEDGLAGFFRQEQGFGCFYTDTDAYETQDSFLNSDISIQLSCVGRQKVTVLLDPMLPFHIITGILPVKRVRIPETCAVKQIEKLDMEVFAAPVLTGRARITLPASSAPGRTWAWVSVKDRQYVLEKEVEDVSDRAYDAAARVWIKEGWLKSLKTDSEAARTDEEEV